MHAAFMLHSGDFTLQVSVFLPLRVDTLLHRQESISLVQLREFPFTVNLIKFLLQLFVALLERLSSALLVSQAVLPNFSAKFFLQLKVEPPNAIQRGHNQRSENFQVIAYLSCCVSKLIAAWSSALK